MRHELPDIGLHLSSGLSVLNRLVILLFTEALVCCGNPPMGFIPVGIKLHPAEASADNESFQNAAHLDCLLRILESLIKILHFDRSGTPIAVKRR